MRQIEGRIGFSKSATSHSFLADERPHPFALHGPLDGSFLAEVENHDGHLVLAALGDGFLVHHAEFLTLNVFVAQFAIQDRVRVLFGGRR